MAASWMLRHRSLRSGRSKSKITFEDEFKLDPTCNSLENAWRLLTQLCTQTISTSRRFSLLNAFVVLSGTQTGYAAIHTIFSFEQLLICLRISLVHESTQIRAGALRALRRIMKTKEHVRMFNEMQLPHLICRCIDIVLKNEMERIQAFQLIRRILILSPETFSPVLTRAMVALGMGGSEQGERLLRACLAILCEIGILNPTQLVDCGGIGAILHNILECHSPRIAESLVGVLLHLLENPESRSHSEICLEMLASPYCDFQYRLGILDKSKDARDIRITCSRLALLSVLRSWAGTLQFCNPDKLSGLSSIISVLYLNQLEVRKAVLDLLYELVGLPQPAWTDEYSVAVATLDPTDFQDHWRLNEGFVVAECRSILPTLVSTVPSPAEQHLALLLYCLLQSGVLPALVEVIVASDTFISVRATILLGKLLNMMHILLPPEIYNSSPTLPNLISYASSNKPQALAAVSVLENLNSIMECKPASASVFLDQLLLAGGLVKTDCNQNESQSQSSDISHFDSSVLSQDKTLRLPKKNKIFKFFTSLRQVEDLIRDSNVLVDKDGASWNWDLIRAVLKSTLKNVSDESHLRFFRRLVQYFSPSCNRFSHQDLGHGRNSLHCVYAGLELVDWLVRCTHPDYTCLLLDLFTDISSHVTAISKSKSAHECLFSPQHMLGTLCQMYFLYIGRLCKYERGLELLQQTDIFSEFLIIVESTNHICYVKLIVSGLDYTLEAIPRKILASALESPVLKTRLYATQFLLVLLRTKAIDFVNWGMPLLVKQIHDKEVSISQVALEILTEACHDKIYLKKLMTIWPPLLSLGDPGRLLRTRLFSKIQSLKCMTSNEIDAEIKHWANYYNKRYVLIVESETHCSLTQNNRNTDITYNQRVTSTRNSNTLLLPTLPPHLYGQLVNTNLGLSYLKQSSTIPEMVEFISQGKCINENEILHMKACIWAIAHMTSHALGLCFLNSICNDLVPKIIKLAKECDVYSVRATAFFALGLTGSTFFGANLLQKLGWVCVRHNRNENWPIVLNNKARENVNKSELISGIFYREEKDWPPKTNISNISFSTNSLDDYGGGHDTSWPSLHSSESVSSKQHAGHSSEKYNKNIQSSIPSLNSLEDYEKSEPKSDPIQLEEIRRPWYGMGCESLKEFGKLLNDSLEGPVDYTGPCYMGICLPLNIKDMFSCEENKQNIAINQELDKSTNWLSEKNYNMEFDMNNFENETAFKHNTTSCLLCCRSRKVQYKSKVLAKIPDTEENTSQANLFSIEDNTTKITCLILKHIQRTSNPVWYKQSKQSLLELKQAHPVAFQDICLYSDMCNSMSTSTYRLNARRFLQELFLDLNFDQFFSDCENILRNLPPLDYVLHRLSTTEENLENEASTSQCNYLSKNKLLNDKIRDISPQEVLSKESSSQDCKASTSSKIEDMHKPDVPRVQVLNLSCTKNKFPITNRIASQATEQKNVLSNTSKIN